MNAVEPLFPEGHPLRRLVRPSFDSLRRSLADIFVATIWIDADEDPSRAGFRPSYDSIHGPGSATMMPFVAAWLSTGPGSKDAAANVVLFPEAMDPSLIDYALEVGLLGPFERVANAAAMKERVRTDPAHRRLYNIDDLGAAFDEHAVVNLELSNWLNSKERLDTITAFAPPETVKDMFDVGAADYDATLALGGGSTQGQPGGRVFLKTCNTENAGMGVFIAHTREEFDAHLTAIRDKQARFDLNRRLVIQPEIRGKNCSFQVMLDPKSRDAIQVVALSDQFVEADGKTYRSSVNHPITAENVEPVGAAILDMVDRIWAAHPQAFGFLMSDYFQTSGGPIIYDPGIRPTGNTATAMAAHLARSITGRFFATSLVPFPTKRPNLGFGEFSARSPELFRPSSLLSKQRAVMPWGWNKIQGFGMLIAIAESEAALDEVREEIAALL